MSELARSNLILITNVSLPFPLATVKEEPKINAIEIAALLQEKYAFLSGEYNVWLGFIVMEW